MRQHIAYFFMPISNKVEKVRFRLAFPFISFTIGDMRYRSTSSLSSLLILLIVIVGCARQTPVPDTTDATPPTATVIAAATTETEPTDTAANPPTPTAVPVPPADNGVLTVAIDVPHKQVEFAAFDDFGNITGLDADLIAAIAAVSDDLAYELIAIPYDAIIDGVQTGKFDMGLSAIVIPEQPEEGIAYTRPYLEIGEQLLVRANETEITDIDSITADMVVSVEAESQSGQIAIDRLPMSSRQLLTFGSVQAAVQELSNGTVRAAVVDNYQASYYINRYPQRFKLAGGFINGSRSFGIAVAADNTDLLTTLNTAIATLSDNENVTAITDRLVDKRPINRGDISLVGTPEDRVLIGVVGTSGDLDPSSDTFGYINWEIKQNTMSGLLRYDQNNQLVPALAATMPTISDDGLKYTFTLREGLFFPDGTLLDANAVRNSLVRASENGNGQLNNFLRDNNLDGFADGDAIQAVGNNQIVLQLDEAASHFVTFLATPPYFILNPSCAAGTFDPLANCNGIGPYTITAYEPDVLVRMEANPLWPLEKAIMSSVELRFYADTATLRGALLSEQIDIVWHGIANANNEEGRALAADDTLKPWAGASVFKSYLVFEQSQEPWDDVRVRRAAAYALDRDALVEKVFVDGERQPLLGPIPSGIPGNAPAAPAPDLGSAITLLNAAGYSLLNPLEIDLWYLDDGRYTEREGDYAAAIKEQLEETGIFEVTLNSEAWPIYSARMSSCEYPAFLLGWPGTTAQRYIDPMIWLGHFIYNAEVVCSNYESEEMSALMASVLEETDLATRMGLYGQVQALWAAELPTLDLTQERNQAYSSADITALTIDPLGIMRYETLQK